VTIFFVSSSDSASYVVDLLTSGGNEEPPTWQRIFWASAEGLTAGILLYAGGTEVLKGLKAGVVSFGLPFCALILVMIYSLVKKLKEEELESQNLESQNLESQNLETESTESIENTSSDA
jgi:choline-glycine betaine transporter